MNEMQPETMAVLTEVSFLSTNVRLGQLIAPASWEKSTLERALVMSMTMNSS
jgi:hypothetical protein